MTTLESKVTPVTSLPVVKTAATPVSQTPLRILIVDDSTEDRMIVRLALESHGYLFSEADTGERGLATARELRPDCILLDYRLPDLDGEEVLQALSRPDGSVPFAVVMLTGANSGEAAAKLLQGGALDYVSKDGLNGENLKRAMAGAVERHRLLEERRHADRRNSHLAAIVGASSSAIVSTDINDLVTSWNPGAEALFGYTEEEAIGLTIEELIAPPQMTDQLRLSYAAVKAGNGPITVENQHRRRNGSLVPVEVNASAIYDRSGAVAGLSFIIRDISDRKRAEDAVVQRNRRLDLLARASHALLHEGESAVEAVIRDIASVLQADTIYSFRVAEDPQWLELQFASGINAEQRAQFGRIKIGTFLCGVVAASRQRLVIEDFQRCALPDAAILQNAGAMRYAGFPLVAGDKLVGTVAFIWRHLTTFGEGEIESIQTLCDQVAITLERSRLAKALQASESRLTFALEAGQAGTWESVPATGAFIASDTALKLHGLRPGQKMNHDIALAAIHPDDQPKVTEALTRTLQTGEPFRLDLRSLHPDGSIVWLRSQAELRCDGPHPRLVGLVHDITERKKAEAELRESEARFRQVTESLPQLVWTCRADGYCDYLSPQWERYTGIKALEQLGAGWVQQLHPEDRERVVTQWEAAARRGETYDIEFRIRRHDGAYRWFRTLAVPIRDESQSVIKWFGTNTDIHEFKQGEIALRESEERLKLAIEASGIGIFTIDLKTRVARYSPELSSMLGFPAVAEAHLDDALVRVHRDDLEHVRAAFEAALDPGGAGRLDMDFRFVRPGGEVRWMTWSGRVHFDESVVPRRPEHFVGTCVDITDRKSRELQLAIAAERVEIAQQAARAMSYEFFPATGQAIQAPAALEALTGYHYEGHPKTGDWWRSIIHPDDVEEAWSEISRGITEGSGFELEYRIRHASGRYLWIHDHAHVFPARDGNPARIIGMVLDISEQKAREEREHLLMREVNHRSKNMLSLIMAIARRSMATQPQDFMERFSQRVQALASNQDLLVKSEWKAVPLRRLVLSQLAHFGAAFEARVTLDGPQLEVSSAASQAIGMALHELATNAAKYGALSNDSGGVTVSWKLELADGNQRFLMSWIESGGPPVEQPSHRGFGSTVIGEMVTMSLGCEAEVEYAPSGLKWRIDCPIDKVVDGHDIPSARPSSGARSAVAGSIPRPRVLVVEDEALIAIEIAATLQEAGWEVVGPANTVAGALGLLSQAGCAAAVLDVNLGIETAEPIAAELIERRIPFITLSGYSREQQPEIMREGPFLRKPLDLEMLVAEVSRCIVTPQ